jgi:hypothetical protein
MRSHWSLLLLLLAACHRPEEIRGLYLSQDSAGVFFPCTDASMVMHIQDSALATSYQELAGLTHQLVFVRLRAVPRDSGSIYGGRHYLDVREVIEIRPRAAEECPGIALTTSPLQAGTR